MTIQFSTTAVREAARRQELIGNHAELGTDDEGWIICRGTVEIEGCTVVVDFTARPDYAEWDITALRVR